LRKSIQVLQKVGTNLMKAQPEQSPTNHHHNTHGMTYGLSSDADALDYKDSVDILGVSMHELEDFINPGTTPRQGEQMNLEDRSQHFISRLNNMDSLPDSMTSDIEEIGEYCCKLIDDIEGK
jgi:hypothetical protein